MPRKPVKKPAAGRPGRDQADVQRVMLRMGKSYVDQLDRLCTQNARSRREIVEFLIADAFLEIQEFPDALIKPL